MSLPWALATLPPAAVVVFALAGRASGGPASALAGAPSTAAPREPDPIPVG